MPTITNAVRITPITLAQVTEGMTLGRFAQWYPGGPSAQNLCGTVTVATVHPFQVFDGAKLAGDRIGLGYREGGGFEDWRNVQVWRVDVVDAC